MMQMSEAAKTALLNAGTNRQGAKVIGGTAAVQELVNAGLIGEGRGLTRKGTIARQRVQDAAMDAIDGALSVRVNATPGPKGSVAAFCTRCAARRLSQRVVVKEESDAGVAFRKQIARQVRSAGKPFTGPIETRLTFYIPRQHQVKGGVVLDAYVPTSQAPVPVHRNSGDVEKLVRVVHDALQDALLLADDCLVWRTVSQKLWADADHPPGVEIEILPWQG